MEGSFGESFSNVRVHTDRAAGDAARGLGARAFATGQDIFFREGAFQPGSPQGKSLLAHELTHTIQQRGSGPRHTDRLGNRAARRPARAAGRTGVERRDARRAAGSGLDDFAISPSAVGGAGHSAAAGCQNAAAADANRCRWQRFLRHRSREPEDQAGGHRQIEEQGEVRERSLGDVGAGTEAEGPDAGAESVDRRDQAGPGRDASRHSLCEVPGQGRTSHRDRQGRARRRSR